jgi:hypothetical protein
MQRTFLGRSSTWIRRVPRTGPTSFVVLPGLGGRQDRWRMERCPRYTSQHETQINGWTEDTQSSFFFVVILIGRDVEKTFARLADRDASRSRKNQQRANLQNQIYLDVFLSQRSTSLSSTFQGTSGGDLRVLSTGTKHLCRSQRLFWKTSHRNPSFHTVGRQPSP